MPRSRKRGPGRPSLGDAARSRVVTIKLTEAEHAAWLALAGDQPLSEWIRQRCATSSESEPLLRVVKAAKDGRASELYDALAALDLKDET